MPKKSEYKPTNQPCIKKRYDGKYLVVLDMGWGSVTDRKTGRQKSAQKKTTRVAGSWEEAVNMLNESNNERMWIKNSRSGYSKFMVNKVTMAKAAGDFYDAGCKGYTKKKWSESKKADMKKILKHFKEYMGMVNVCDITEDVTRGYFEHAAREGNSKDKKGLASSTLGKHYYAMVELFAFIMENDAKYTYRHGKNIAENSYRVPGIVYAGEDKEAEWLDIGELQATLDDALRNEEDKSIALIIALGAIGGLRRGEIAAMDMENFYYREGFMQVSKSRKEIAGKDVTGRPKSGKKRITACPGVLKEIAGRALQQNCDVTGKSMEDLKENNIDIVCPLWHLKNNRELRAKRISVMWRDYQKRRNTRLKAAGKNEIKIIKLHELRHTHATLLFNEGINITDISLNMGHSIPGTSKVTKGYIHSEVNKEEINNFWDSSIKVNI